MTPFIKMIVCFVEKSDSKLLLLACSGKCVMQTTTDVRVYVNELRVCCSL